MTLGGGKRLTMIGDSAIAAAWVVAGCAVLVNHGREVVFQLLALLAALAFALGSVLQQRGTLEAPAPEGDPRFLTQILRSPIWLAGAGSQGLGWILQALALDRGSLIVVQSLTALSLVFALPLGARITRQRITPRVVLGACAVVVGVIFVVVVEEGAEGAAGSTSTGNWFGVCLISSILVGMLYVIGRRTVGAAKALLYGAGAGLAYALQAAVTKEFLTVIGQGAHAVVTSWTIYTLIGSAILGFAMQQSALKTGILAPAIGSSNGMTLLFSVVLAGLLFGERLTTGTGRSWSAILGLLLMLAGIALLAEAEPPRPPRDRGSRASEGPTTP